VVRDTHKRLRLQELYYPTMRSAMDPVLDKLGLDLSSPDLPKSVRGPLHLAQHLHEIPVIAVPCVDMSLVITRAGGPGVVATLAETELIDGSHVYPSIQNFLLACRNEGLGTALTTALCAYQDEMRTLLGLPACFVVAAAIAVGWPEREVRRLTRQPVEESVFVDRYGDGLFTDTLQRDSTP
jgi:hypothetical protein